MSNSGRDGRDIANKKPKSNLVFGFARGAITAPKPASSSTKSSNSNKVAGGSAYAGMKKTFGR